MQTVHAVQTVETLTQAAVAAIQALPANHAGYKEVAQQLVTPGGQLAVCTVSVTASRSGKANMRTQYKVNGKVIARATLDRLLSGEREERPVNAALRADFQAYAPVLAAEIARELASLWDGLERKHPVGVPFRPQYDDADYWVMAGTFARLVDNQAADGMERFEGRAVLNLGRVEAFCKDYGLSTALQWFRKTGHKLGELAQPALLLSNQGDEDAVDRDVIIEGRRGDQLVQMVQRRVVRRSPHGKLFHQFQARIFVDCRPCTESAYRKHLLNVRPSVEDAVQARL